MLKDFFESHIEQDKFEKLKDGYVILDTNTNVCYFKKITLDSFLKKKGSKIFSTTSDALRMLGCVRKEYVKKEKNVWCVEMPEFVSHTKLKPKKSKKVSEIDDDHHKKFRSAEAETNIQEDH